MFAWVKKLFRKDSPEYTDEERGIYSYWDGTKGFSWRNPNRHADPLPLYNKIYARRLEIKADFDAVKQYLVSDEVWEKFVEPARVRLTKVVREIFGIRPLINGNEIPPEGTLKDSEALDLLDDFLVYSERLKKNLPTSAVDPTPSSHSDSSSAGVLTGASTAPSR